MFSRTSTRGSRLLPRDARKALRRGAGARSAQIARRMCWRSARPWATVFRTVLASQPYFGGEAPAYADYAVFGCFQWARCISSFPLLLETIWFWSLARLVVIRIDGIRTQGTWLFGVTRYSAADNSKFTAATICRALAAPRRISSIAFSRVLRWRSSSYRMLHSASARKLRNRALCRTRAHRALSALA